MLPIPADPTRGRSITHRAVTNGAMPLATADRATEIIYERRAVRKARVTQVSRDIRPVLCV